MPGVFVETVRASGGTHTGIAAGIASANAYNCVGNDNIFKLEIENTGAGTDGEWLVNGSVSAYDINNVNTDTTRYIWITTFAGTSFRENANALTNALRYNPANGTAYRRNATGGNRDCFSLTAGYVLIEGLQLKSEGLSPVSYTANSTTKGLVIRNCICVSTSTFASVVRFPTASPGGTQYIGIINTVGYGSPTALSQAFGTALPAKIIASTLYGGGTTARLITTVTAGDLANAVVASTLGMNYPEWANNTNGGWGSGSDYNGTNLSSGATRTAPGANSTYGLPSTRFENVGTGTEDFRLTAGDVGLPQMGTEGVLTLLGTNGVDILGQARSATQPSIGAFEFVSAGGGSAAAIISYYTQMGA